MSLAWLAGAPSWRSGARYSGVPSMPPRRGRSGRPRPKASSSPRRRGPNAQPADHAAAAELTLHDVAAADQIAGARPARAVVGPQRGLEDVLKPARVELGDDRDLGRQRGPRDRRQQRLVALALDRLAVVVGELEIDVGRSSPHRSMIR